MYVLSGIPFFFVWLCFSANSCLREVRKKLFYACGSLVKTFHRLMQNMHANYSVSISEVDCEVSMSREFIVWTCESHAVCASVQKNRFFSIVKIFFSFLSVHFRHVGFHRANKCSNLNQLIFVFARRSEKLSAFCTRCLKFAFANLDVGAFVLQKCREHDWKCELCKVGFSAWILSMHISVNNQRAWTWSEVS